MANFTKKAIKETFVELLEEHPLSDITIKDIVEKCGINRNSFYYHYHDLPESAFLFVGTIDEAVAKAAASKNN